MSVKFISTKLSPTKNIEIVQYTERSIAVTGSDTKEFKDSLKAVGGFFNQYLKCGPGWIFPKREEAQILELLNKLISESENECCKISYKPRETSKCFTFLSMLDLHQFYSGHMILELLKEAGYKYPAKFFRQISTHTGNNIPQLLEETENGWKVIHNCVQKCSFTQPVNTTNYVSRTEFDVANLRLDDIKEQITKIKKDLQQDDEDQDDEDQDDEDQDDEDQDDPDYKEEEHEEEEEDEHDDEEEDEYLEEIKQYVSRAEFKTANLRIRDLQDQINKLKTTIYRIEKPSENSEEDLPDSEEENSEDIEHIGRLIQNVEESSKRCDRCVTM
jgi:hypothetical protein